jgi:hypothetical protein
MFGNIIELELGKSKASNSSVSLIIAFGTEESLFSSNNSLYKSKFIEVSKHGF